LSLQQICSFTDRILNDFTTANNENEREKKVKEGKEIEGDKTHDMKAVLKAPNTLKDPIHPKGPHTL